MTGTVSIVRPTETFTLDKGLPEEFLKQNEHGAKETPENREEKLQELLRMINETKGGVSFRVSEERKRKSKDEDKAKHPRGRHMAGKRPNFSFVEMRCPAHPNPE
ncbi:hypothetical protein RUM44_007000 [Polyplax serrata]|uniref:Uncharacterized protein n=1 Tax=Polyplax serrata TaxID=468196 RepID=A0ABR1AZG0_POLSC